MADHEGLAPSQWTVHQASSLGRPHSSSPRETSIIPSPPQPVPPTRVPYSTCLSGCACIRPQVCDWVLENGFDPAAIDGLDGDALLSLEVPTIVGLQIAKTPDELRRFLELING